VAAQSKSTIQNQPANANKSHKPLRKQTKKQHPVQQQELQQQSTSRTFGFAWVAPIGGAAIGVSGVATDIALPSRLPPGSSGGGAGDDTDLPAALPATFPNTTAAPLLG
jgi:hypothetical protein